MLDHFDAIDGIDRFVGHGQVRDRRLDPLDPVGDPEDVGDTARRSQPPAIVLDGGDLRFRTQGERKRQPAVAGADIGHRTRRTGQAQQRLDKVAHVFVE
jgi:hypothetical protein